MKTHIHSNSKNVPQIEGRFDTAANRHRCIGYDMPVRAGDSPVIE